MSRVLATSARWMIEASGRTDAASLLARLGIDDTTSTSHLVDAEEYYAIVELIVADGIDDLAFRSARALEIDTYGALGLVFKTSPDLRAALGRVERYGRLVSHAIRYELRADEHGGAAFVIAGRQPTRRGEEVTNVAALAGTLAFCRQAVDPRSSDSAVGGVLLSSATSVDQRPRDVLRVSCGVRGDEGARFDDLVVDVQKSVAMSLLSDTDHSLVDVAFMAGYADQTAFQRALNAGLARPRASSGAAEPQIGRSGQSRGRRSQEVRPPELIR